ncbi:hypothetical protein [Halioxenophilus aromaticivorans]|uniref:hypothetical protein n=1 Tax=Halioxenophilus aromaticivorans TaxID=1306992 RepID=UPI0031EB680B
MVCLTAFGVGATCVWRLIKQYRGELIYDGQWWLRRESSGNVILDQSLEPSAAHIVHPNLLLLRFRGGLMTGPSTFWLSRLNVDVEQLRKLRVFVQTQRF